MKVWFKKKFFLFTKDDHVAVCDKSLIKHYATLRNFFDDFGDLMFAIPVEINYKILTSVFQNRHTPKCVLWLSIPEIAQVIYAVQYLGMDDYEEWVPMLLDAVLHHLCFLDSKSLESAILNCINGLSSKKLKVMYNGSRYEIPVVEQYHCRSAHGCIVKWQLSKRLDISVDRMILKDTSYYNSIVDEYSCLNVYDEYLLELK